MNPRVWTQTASYDVASNICQALLCGKLARGFLTTFVAVIHAPRASVFADFTDLILLAPAG